MVKQGHAKTTHQHCITGSGFFVIKIQPFFQFLSDWYRKIDVRENVLQYYCILRLVLRNKPYLRKCLARCKYCRIFFLTHPRNEDRTDLGCPFGCRDAHRKGRDNKRSKKYYQTPEGKKKKSYINLNARRKKKVQFQKYSANGEKMTFDEKIVSYLETVLSLIEERHVSQREILFILAKKKRQHRIGKKRGVAYTCAYYWRMPP